MLLLSLSLLVAATPDTGTWRKIAVYHVNPLHEGVLPLNMDTADLNGDMFFDLRSKVESIECSPANRHSSHSSDCSNGEVVDTDLVVTKLTLEVRGGVGEYGRCNICLKSGVDPFTGLSCTPGEYFCTCGSYYRPHACNNDTTVGVENITEAFGGWPSCSWDEWVEAPWRCWSWPVVKLTGGMWYSTTEAGWCDAEGADPQACSWRVASLDKIVNKSCSDKAIFAAVRAQDASHGRCMQQRCSAAERANTSSVCFIYCFYSTVLGAHNMLPGVPFVAGEAGGGMSASQLGDAFSKPFLPESAGGCPAIAPPKDALSARKGGKVPTRLGRTRGALAARARWMRARGTGDDVASA